MLLLVSALCEPFSSTREHSDRAIRPLPDALEILISESAGSLATPATYALVPGLSIQSEATYGRSETPGAQEECDRGSGSWDAGRIKKPKKKRSRRRACS